MNCAEGLNNEQVELVARLMHCLKETEKSNNKDARTILDEIKRLMDLNRLSQTKLTEYIAKVENSLIVA